MQSGVEAKRKCVIADLRRPTHLVVRISLADDGKAETLIEAACRIYFQYLQPEGDLFLPSFA